MTGATLAAVVFLVVLILGLAVSVPAYSRLLRYIELDHPSEYEALGRPTLLMASPTRSLALQRFIYEEAKRSRRTPRVLASCRFLAVFTPLFVLAVFGTIAWVVASIASAV